MIQNFEQWKWALDEAEFSAQIYQAKYAVVDNNPYYGVMPLSLVTNQRILEVVNGMAETHGGEDPEIGDEGAEEGGAGIGASAPAGVGEEACGNRV